MLEWTGVCVLTHSLVQMGLEDARLTVHNDNKQVCDQCGSFSKVERRRLVVHGKILRLACSHDTDLHLVWRSREHPQMRVADGLAEGNLTTKRTMFLSSENELVTSVSPDRLCANIRSGSIKTDDRHPEGQPGGQTGNRVPV